ncbi:MAG: TIR domain-containing protein, partial [Oligoflexia bacterium]|nr:TIR domain-containing protein [Oligoflexia bacterium]
MRIFISYSHDSDGHRDAVAGFANCLRRHGYDAWIDQFAVDPDEGWLRWMRDQIEAADVVLIVPTATYLRRWKGHEQPGKGMGA